MDGPDDAEPIRVFLRPLGTPLPLGFGGLAVATAMVSAFNLGWIQVSEQHQVGLILIAFPFPLQALATVLLFLARDAPAGAGIGVQAVTWLTIGVLLLTGTPGSRSAALAVLLFAAAAALTPSAATSFLSKAVGGAVMAASALRFVLTGLYEKMGGTGWEHAAGWEGIVLAVLALYAALATDLEGALHREALPLGRRGTSARTFQPSSVDDNVPQVRGEPGVRPQL